MKMAKNKRALKNFGKKKQSECLIVMLTFNRYFAVGISRKRLHAFDAGWVLHITTASSRWSWKALLFEVAIALLYNRSRIPLELVVLLQMSALSLSKFLDEKISSLIVRKFQNSSSVPFYFVGTTKK